MSKAIWAVASPSGEAQRPRHLQLQDKAGNQQDGGLADHP
jgi:hypothetical protein